MYKKGITTLFIATFLFPLFLKAQNTVLTEFEDFYPEQLKSAGFILSSGQEISIDASAITPYRSRTAPFTNAWILNSDTREVVWEIADAEDVDRTRSLTTFEDRFSLDAGKYEVYYSTYPNKSFMYNNWDRNKHGFFDNLFGNIFYGEEWDVNRRDYDELFFKITGNGKSATEDDVIEWQNQVRKNSIFTFTELRDDIYEEKILDVKKPAEIKVYGLGEALNDGQYDYGWIVNLKTREKVWELNYRRSLHAGGAEKNRLSERIIKLEPGKYKIVFVTDDSHSYRRWNSAPPYDPSFWGITIWSVNDQDKSAFAINDAAEYEEKNIIIDFDRVGDQDYRVQGFTLKKSIPLHIYALGEGRDGEMFDYGWIVNAKNREKVWVMDYYDTENAGGARKNRIFDDIVELGPGNYLAYYVSDGSHSYRRWNSGAPFDQKSWGMRISAAVDNFDPSDVSRYDESDDKTILVRITRIGDYDRARADFNLDRDQKVHIYAIGEGRHNEMYDYAWIEDSNTGRIVWEMTYRTTERAGGARKNRLFDGTIFLEAGEYDVFYETDDSHSFADWNEAPPNDPINWGITITRLED